MPVCRPLFSGSSAARRGLWNFDRSEGKAAGPMAEPATDNA